MSLYLNGAVHWKSQVVNNNGYYEQPLVSWFASPNISNNLITPKIIQGNKYGGRSAMLGHGPSNSYTGDSSILDMAMQQELLARSFGSGSSNAIGNLSYGNITDIEYGINRIFSPKYIKESPSTKSLLPVQIPFVSFSMVNDLEDCAKLQEISGYKVHEPITNISNLFNDSFIIRRGYFNVIQFSSVNIELNNTINSDTILANIESRLLNGLRLWTDPNNIGNYTQYDNYDLYDNESEG